MSSHKKFQSRIKKEYEDKGYTVNLEEAFIKDDGSYWVIDVTARNKKESIAIEIGNTYINKLDDLKKKFDKVIHIPFFSRTKDGFIYHLVCGYKWKPRIENPKECPNCKNRVILC